MNASNSPRSTERISGSHSPGSIVISLEKSPPSFSTACCSSVYRRLTPMGMQTRLPSRSRNRVMPVDLLVMMPPIWHWFITANESSDDSPCWWNSSWLRRTRAMSTSPRASR